MKRSLFLAIVLFLVFSTVAYAQDRTPADELVNAVVATVAAVGALISGVVIDAIKKSAYFGADDKDKLAEAVTLFVSVGVSLITGYAVALAAQALNLISDAALQATVVAVLTPVLSELRYRLAKLSPT